MVEQEPTSFPIGWVGKEDLLSCRPDLADKIEALTENDLESIAGEVGEALQEDYWMALGMILTRYLGEESAPHEDDESGEETS